MPNDKTAVGLVGIYHEPILNFASEAKIS